MEVTSNTGQAYYCLPTDQGCTKGQKSGGAGSNAARRCCPEAPSDLPKSGGAAAPPAPPLGASLFRDNGLKNCFFHFFSFSFQSIQTSVISFFFLF